MFEWDEAKRLANLKKHGVDFADVEEFDWDRARIDTDDRFAYGEERLTAFGLYRGEVYMVVHTEQGSTKRIISFRKATRREAQTYYERRDRS